VTRPGGRVLATEFCWCTPPTPQAREVFLGQVCPGMHFDTVEDWVRIYASAGLTGLDTQTGPFEMMTARGFLAGEGLARCLAIMSRVAGGPPAPARWPGSCRAWPRPSLSRLRRDRRHQARMSVWRRAANDSGKTRCSRS
jgi:hypothetical protein